MRLKLEGIWEYLRWQLWFLPAVFVVSAFVLAEGTLALDRHLRDEVPTFLVFKGGADGARTLLSAIAASTFTFTGVVFSITMLVLQLASSQLSPRVLRTFLRDLGTQVVLAAFVATLVFSILILREIRSEDDPFVPGISITVAVILLLTTIGLFVYFISHISHSIRASTITANIGRETRKAIDQLYPADFENEPDEQQILKLDRPATIIYAKQSGVVTGVDEKTMANLVKENGAVIGVVPMIGDFVAEGSKLAVLWGDPQGLDEDLVHQAVRLGQDRTMQQDAAFGFRQLVDIAEKALSPGFNDPTTAVQVLDQIHNLLKHLGRREIPSALRFDGSGELRLILPRPSWADYVGLGLDEIRMYGTNSLQVLRRLRFLLEDLLGELEPARRGAIQEQLLLLEEAVDRGMLSSLEKDKASKPSRQAHGGRSANLVIQALEATRSAEVRTPSAQVTSLPHPNDPISA